MYPRPVTYASKSLTKTERRYANIEREILFSCDIFLIGWSTSDISYLFSAFYSVLCAVSQQKMPSSSYFYIQIYSTPYTFYTCSLFHIFFILALYLYSIFLYLALLFHIFILALYCIFLYLLFISMPKKNCIKAPRQHQVICAQRYSSLSGWSRERSTGKQIISAFSVDRPTVNTTSLHTAGGNQKPTF